MSAPATNPSKMPDIIYGTAFAFEETETLVSSALKAGFLGLDTSGSLSAYREDLVGASIKNSIEQGIVQQREKLFIQTKFSPFKSVKDPALYPYDTTAAITEQVSQSLDASLANLGVDYIDSLILHSLCETPEATLETWRAMERHVPSRVRALGMSNTDLESLQMIWEHAVVKPASVQNRLTADVEINPAMPPGVHYPDSRYDLNVRSFCGEKGIRYTPWGVLWSNPDLLAECAEMAGEVGVSQEIVFYACLQSFDWVVLCGTKRVERMKENIEGLERVREFVKVTERNTEVWNAFVERIRGLIAEE